MASSSRPAVHHYTGKVDTLDEQYIEVRDSRDRPYLFAGVSVTPGDPASAISLDMVDANCLGPAGRFGPTEARRLAQALQLAALIAEGRPAAVPA